MQLSVVLLSHKAHVKHILIILGYKVFRVFGKRRCKRNNVELIDYGYGKNKYKIVNMFGYRAVVSLFFTGNGKRILDQNNFKLFSAEVRKVMG